MLALDGDEALSVARARRPRAIVLDLLLPKVSGLSVLTAIKSDPALAAIPVIRISVEAQRARGFSLGRVRVPGQAGHGVASRRDLDCGTCSSDGYHGGQGYRIPAYALDVEVATAVRHDGPAPPMQTLRSLGKRACPDHVELPVADLIVPPPDTAYATWLDR